MIKAAEALIALHGLKPHPEGGFYRETYRTALMVETDDGIRSAGTAILYLLSGTDVSRFHRIDADEIWHFHTGGALEIHSLASDGTAHIDILNAHNPQVTIKAGLWFGAILAQPGSYCLVGCTVSPGFEFSGFELAKKATLLKTWPDESEIISRLT